jgi:hypothetical protein
MRAMERSQRRFIALKVQEEEGAGRCDFSGAAERSGNWNKRQESGYSA